MIKNWNSLVKSEDTVFHLGDFSMRNIFKKFRDRLNGHIVFIKGNHDDESIIHDLTIDYYGKMWHLVHDPKEAELDFNICGHVHGNWKLMKTEDGKIIYNCGVDVNAFRPIKIDEILDKVQKYEKGQIDSLGNVI